MAKTSLLELRKNWKERWFSSTFCITLSKQTRLQLAQRFLIFHHILIIFVKSKKWCYLRCKLKVNINHRCSQLICWCESNWSSIL